MKNFLIKTFKEVEHRKFLNSQESVVVFKFKNTNKKDLIVRYCLDADKVALYLNQVIKNRKIIQELLAKNISRCWP
jgi:hypothetical protein